MAPQFTLVNILTCLAFTGFVAATPIDVSSSPLRLRDSSPVLSAVSSLPANSIDNADTLASNLTAIAHAIENEELNAASAAAAYSSMFNAIAPADAPALVEDIQTLLQSTATNLTSQNIITKAMSLLLKGVTPPSAPVDKRASSNIDNFYNVNPPISSSIYPKIASSPDPSYSIPEYKLRQAIYIPDTFTYGAKQPVILVAGTCLPSGSNFAPNIAKLLKASDFADPVWLNMPGYQLGDIQLTGEYVAYAINYMAALTSRNVSTITWSQGSIDAQWAFKYWPSTRNVTTDHIALSGDYHGSLTVYLLCPPSPLPKLFCDAAVFQQTRGSKFIAKLRSNDGDSAYVPVTTVYSNNDLIVTPQTDPNASSFINDVRGVGVSNNQVQTVCADQPAGGFYAHEGTLYHPLSWALIQDALTHDGPGDLSRLDLSKVCSTVVTPGLNGQDVIATEATQITAAKNVLGHWPKVMLEPAIMSYATY